ncbi:MAG: prenyltransferase [SAR324 cluster bacterium]|nr:prenyltransferase [SAR324 cluster bacterium]
MNVSMWVKSLTVAQHVSQDEWKELDIISRWLIAVRGSFFPPTIFASILLCFFALHAQKLDIGIWLLVSLGLVLSHATVNFFNDITDHVMGVDDDKAGYRHGYAAHPLASGYMSKSAFIIRYASVSAIGALAVGFALLYIKNQDIGIWILFLSGAIAVTFYTWPFKVMGLGNIVTTISWGPLMIGGGYYVITGEWSNYVLLASIPYSLGVSGVLLGAHMDKYNEYKKGNIKTLPVLLGMDWARRIEIVSLITPFVIIFALYMVGFFHFTIAITLLAIPKLITTIKIYASRRPTGKDEIKDKVLKQAWPLYYTVASTRYDKIFGPLYILAVLVDALMLKFVL